MQPLEKTFRALGMLAGLWLLAGAASAQAGGGDHRGPPPEALAACKALTSGNDCSFTSPHGAVKGTCWAPEGKPLACKPAGAPPTGGSPPPAKP
jgi:hypothetical protein